MSIKKNNIELEQKIRNLKNDNSISDFISDVSKYQKYYSLLRENCNQFTNSFKKLPSSPSELNSKIKDSFNKIDSNLKKLNNILQKYHVAFVYSGIEQEYDSFSYISSPGSPLPTKNYKDVINAILSRVNSSTKKFNAEITSIKNTYKYYEKISNYLMKSIQYLDDAKGKYVNNEIEVDGSKKLTLFRSRVRETSKLLKDFDVELKSYITSLKKIQKIDIQDFSLKME